MDPLTIAMTAAKYAPAIKQGWDWLTGKKGPSRSGSVSAAEKSYIANLKLRMKEGMSGQQVNQMLSQTTRAVGTATDLAKTNVQGVAVSQGIEDSGVVAEQMLNVDQSGSAEIAQTARMIAEENLKIQESSRVEMGKYGIQQSNQKYSEALRDYASQEGRIGGVLKTVSGVAGDYMTDLEHSADLEQFEGLDWFQALTPEQKADLIASLPGRR